jgi:hypothetical protein
MPLWHQLMNQKPLFSIYENYSQHYQTTLSWSLVVNLYIPHNRRTPLQAEEALGPIFIPRGSRGVNRGVDSPKVINRISKISYGHLCLREENLGLIDNYIICLYRCNIS